MLLSFGLLCSIILFVFHVIGYNNPLTNCKMSCVLYLTNQIKHYSVYRFGFSTLSPEIASFRYSFQTFLSLLFYYDFLMYNGKKYNREGLFLYSRLYIYSKYRLFYHYTILCFLLIYFLMSSPKGDIIGKKFFLLLDFVFMWYTTGSNMYFFLH